MKKRNITAASDNLELYQKLYDRNFPEDERIPFGHLLASLSDSRQMFAWYEDDRLIGLTVIFAYEDMIYLAYLVVEESERGSGYGSRILQMIRESYHSCRIVVDIEQVDSEIKKKRRDFYFRNGYESTGVYYHFYGVDYELLSTGGRVTGDEYRNLILHHWGKIARSAVFQDHPF